MAKKGEKISERHRQILRDVNLGRNLSKETRLKMSLAKKGKPSPRKGKNLTEEVKQKISLSKKGCILSEETKKKISKNSAKFLLGKHLSEETKNKISFSKLKNPLKGEHHPNWVKDRTLLRKSEKKHLDGRYREWMLGVKRRDSWKCRLLSSDCRGRLESHHIFNWIDYPELRYLLTNGITLCHFHHPRGREQEKRMIPILQELLSVSEE